MKIAIVGCGYVADFYMETLPNHPELELVAVCDINPERRAAFAAYYGVRVYESVNELLAHSDAELILNLTDPNSHALISRASLSAGRHVYSEKPLAMDFDTARELMELAESRGLSISGAPCSLYSEAADNVRRAFTSGDTGVVRAVFAEMSDGRPSLASMRNWRSASGAPWPYASELALGSTIQHAGYSITLLMDFFGPVKRLHSFGSVCCPDTQTELQLGHMSPDFTVSVLEFQSGVVARVTCDRVATRRDRSMHFIGDKGTLTIKDVWRYDAPVYFTPMESDGTTLRSRFRRRLDREIRLIADHFLPGQHWRGFRLPSPPAAGHLTKDAGMDFARGPARQARAIVERRQPLISAELLLHVTEIALVMQYPAKYGSPYNPRSKLPGWTGREGLGSYLPKQ